SIVHLPGNWLTRTRPGYACGAQRATSETALPASRSWHNAASVGTWGHRSGRKDHHALNAARRPLPAGPRAAPARRRRGTVGRLPSAEPGHQPCQQRGARYQGRHLDVLFERMRAAAHDAEPVQGRNAERTGEIAIRTAAVLAVWQLETELGGDAPCP